MDIAILGGTGKEGAGLGARWARAGHTILIGSRDAARAAAKAAELRERTGMPSISGYSNVEAARRAPIIVIALPATGLAATLPEVREACRGKVVVSTVVPLTFGGPRLFTPPVEGSAAEQVQALLPEARVVGAFHHIAAHELSATEHEIECDLLVCGADAVAKEAAMDLGRSMNLRPLDAGPLTNAGPVEGITAVLATINRRYKIKNSGIKLTGV